MAGHDIELPYEQIWTSNGFPSYNHYFVRNISEVQEYKRHILLLRDYCAHASATPPLGHIGPFPGGHDGFTAHGGDPGGGCSRYVHQIKKFDLLQLPKKIIYFEDLIKDNKALIEAANFAGIDYDLEKIDFDFIRQKSKKLYLSIGHVSAHRAVWPISQSSRTEITGRIKSLMENDEIYDRYLKRYEKE